MHLCWEGICSLQQCSSACKLVMLRLLQHATMRCAAGDLQDAAQHLARPGRDEHLGRGLGVLQGQPGGSGG